MYLSLVTLNSQFTKGATVVNGVKFIVSCLNMVSWGRRGREVGGVRGCFFEALNESKFGFIPYVACL